MKRWLLPIVLALVVMGGYQWFVAPVVDDLRADWAFLHYARIQAIQQAQRAAKPAEPAK